MLLKLEFTIYKEHSILVWSCIENDGYLSVIVFVVPTGSTD